MIFVLFYNLVCIYLSQQPLCTECITLSLHLKGPGADSRLNKKPNNIMHEILSPVVQAAPPRPVSTTNDCGRQSEPPSWTAPPPVTLPGETPLSWTCGPGPTFRTPGSPLCPAWDRGHHVRAWTRARSRTCLESEKKQGWRLGYDDRFELLTTV